MATASGLIRYENCLQAINYIGNCSVWLSIINTVHTSFLYSAYRALGSIFQQQRAAKINRLSEYNRLTALSICPLGGILSHLKHPWQCL